MNKRPVVQRGVEGAAYLVSACEGLGTAGDACPIVMPCTRGRWRPRGITATCSVAELPGLGYNLSAIPVPEDVRAAARLAGLEVAFLATTRKWRWARPCDNEYTRRGDNGPGGTSGRPEWSSVTATDVLLLDSRLKVLARAPITGGRCMQHNHAAEDARLLGGGPNEVWASYVLYNHSDAQCVGGHWLARLRGSNIFKGGPEHAFASCSSGNWDGILLICHMRRYVSSQVVSHVPSMHTRI